MFPSRSTWARGTVVLPVLALTAIAAVSWHVRVAADDPVSSSVRYNREIVRIFDRKCTSCHMKDGLAEPLTTYQDVRSWARAIREEILERRMPPWTAATGVKPLANDPTITTRELAIITAWIDGGTPRGEPADLPPSEPALEWRAGNPDTVLTIPPQTITADGNPQVRRVILTAPRGPTRWLRGFDIVPGQRRALRSAFLYLKTSEDREQWIGAWTPWHAMTTTPEGTAYQLAGGATLVAELHYLAWDEPAVSMSDTSRIGLYLQQSPPASALRQLVVSATRAEPGEGRTKLRGDSVLAEDTFLWAFRPRLDQQAIAAQGSVEVSAIRPDGGVEPLMWLKENGPEWQFPYVLREPVRLPQGSRIVVTALPGADAKPEAVQASVSLIWFGSETTRTSTTR